MAQRTVPREILACMLTGAGMGHFCEYTGPAAAEDLDASACTPPRKATEEQRTAWEASQDKSLAAFVRLFAPHGPPPDADPRDLISHLSHEMVDIAPFAPHFRPHRIPNYRPGPGECLAKVQAICLCFSDCKIIHQGGSHFRLHGRDLAKEPNVPGHEGCLEIVQLGQDTEARHGIHLGDRYAIQADIYVDGVTHAFGYHHRGCLQQYTLIPEEVVENDRGNCLIPNAADRLEGGPFLKEDLGRAETALAEPWGCVVANIPYRTALKDGGTTWFLGATGDHLDEVREAAATAGRLLLTGGQAEALAAEVDAEAHDTIEAVREAVGEAGVDDVVVKEPSARLVEQAAELMAPHAVMLLPPFEPGTEAELDIGAIHYQGLLFLGHSEPTLAATYATPRRTTLRPGGRALFIGAGGPMGQIWLQIAIDSPTPPAWMLVTEIDDARLEHLDRLFRPQAEARGIELHFANPLTTDLADLVAEGSLDDVVGLTPAWGPIKAAERFVVDRGVINIFAGIKVGTKGAVDIGRIASRGVTAIGNSGSAVEDLRSVIVGSLRGELRPNASVAVIGPIAEAWEAMRQVMYRETSGKICLFPELALPTLLPLDQLAQHFPTVAEKLDPHGLWTREAEEELFRVCPRVQL